MVEYPWNHVEEMEVRQSMAASAKKRLVGKESLLDIMAARAFAYSFLSRAFFEEPSKEFLTLLVEQELIDSFVGLEESALLKAGHDSLSFALRDPDILTDESVEDLAADYNRIFIGLGKKKSVSVYESVHRSTDRLVFQKDTMAVRAAYAKHDLKVERFQQEPDDHIGLELLFMQKLSEKCLKEMRGNRYHKARRILKDQLAFLDDHILKWVPKMAGKVVDNSQTNFFQGAGKMLGGHVKFDREMVDNLIDEITARIKQHKDKNEMRPA